MEEKERKKERKKRKDETSEAIINELPFPQILCRLLIAAVTTTNHPSIHPSVNPEVLFCSKICFCFCSTFAEQFVHTWTSKGGIKDSKTNVQICVSLVAVLFSKMWAKKLSQITYLVTLAVRTYSYVL